MYRFYFTGALLRLLMLSIICVLCSVAGMYAQLSSKGGALGGNALYYSSQNGGRSTLTGSITITKSDPKFEHGSAHLSADGPVIISPTDFSMGVGEPMSETFTGAVTVDPATAPAAGESAPATIEGKYDFYYSCPMDLPCKPGNASFIGASWNCEVGPGPGGHCSAGHTYPGGPHSMVEQSGSEVERLTVYSIHDTIIGPGCVARGDTATYTAASYPGGGTLVWSNGRTGPSITVVIDKPQTISAVYTIAGVSYTASVDVNICCKCEDIKIQWQPPAIWLGGANRPPVRIYDPNNIEVPIGRTAIFYVIGCDQLTPKWTIDPPAYFVVTPPPKDSMILLSLGAGPIYSGPADPRRAAVGSKVPGKYQVCVTYDLSTGPCTRCVTVNFVDTTNPCNSPYDHTRFACIACGGRNVLSPIGWKCCDDGNVYDPLVSKCSSCSKYVPLSVMPVQSACCDGVPYDPATTRCGKCADAEPLTIIHIGSECCNGVSFDPRVSKCLKCKADGPSSIVPLDWQCCNGQPFNPAVSKCAKCTPGAVPMVIALSQECCNGVPFDPTKEKCVPCGPNRESKIIPVGWECCNGEAYDPMVAKCVKCGGSSKIMPVGWECCNGEAFDPKVSTCVRCGNTSKIVPVGWECCNGAPFDPRTSRCIICGPGREARIVPAGWECCNGVSYDPKVSRCVLNKVTGLHEIVPLSK